MSVTTKGGKLVVTPWPITIGLGKVVFYMYGPDAVKKIRPLPPSGPPPSVQKPLISPGPDPFNQLDSLTPLISQNEFSTTVRMANPDFGALTPDGRTQWVSFVGNGAANPGSGGLVGFPSTVLSDPHASPVVIADDAKHDLVAPAGVAVDSQGTLWVADLASHRVLGYRANQLQASGSPTPAVAIDDNPTGTTDGLSGLAVDGQGHVWVTRSTSNGQQFIDEYAAPNTGTTTPTAIRRWALPLVAGAAPRALAFDPAGNLWIAEHSFAARIDKADLGASRFPTPTLKVTPTAEPAIGANNLAFDSAGDLVLTGVLTLSGYTAAQLAAGNVKKSAIVVGPFNDVVKFAVLAR